MSRRCPRSKRRSRTSPAAPSTSATTASISIASPPTFCLSKATATSSGSRAISRITRKTRSAASARIRSCQNASNTSISPGASLALRGTGKTYKHIFMSSDDPQGLSRAQALAGLRAAGEATRLRILALLAAAGELNVKDLTQILGQSQPRISRHLKLMAEAGLIRRFREGSWVFFRLAESGVEATLARAIVASLEPTDLTLARDRARATAVAKARAEAAQTYFKAHASEWDEIRALHVAEREVENAMDAALGQGPFTLLVDLGTGTGRMLELFAARATRALGFDLSRDM